MILNFPSKEFPTGGWEYIGAAAADDCILFQCKKCGGRIKVHENRKGLPHYCEHCGCENYKEEHDDNPKM